MAKEFLEGNFAMAEAAVRAGVEAYFGYPITPQTELLEWMSHRMPELTNCENPSAAARGMYLPVSRLAPMRAAWCSGKYGATPNARNSSTGPSAEQQATRRVESFPAASTSR